MKRRGEERTLLLSFSITELLIYFLESSIPVIINYRDKQSPSLMTTMTELEVVDRRRIRRFRSHHSLRGASVECEFVPFDNLRAERGLYLAVLLLRRSINTKSSARFYLIEKFSRLVKSVVIRREERGARMPSSARRSARNIRS